MKKSTALIGYTGFVGKNIARNKKFTHYFNRKNIETIHNKYFDLVISAGTSSLKWKANQEPEEDWNKIESLLHHLNYVSTRMFVLISTVDVYPNPIDVDEHTSINTSLSIQTYGNNRYKMEQFVKKHFRHHLIIRLPQLFGPGLKKNFIYDLLHTNALDFTHKDSVFQWYNVEYLWNDIRIALTNNIPLLNVATEPMTAKEVALALTGKNFKTVTKTPQYYDFRSKYAKLFGSSDDYLYHKKQILIDLKKLFRQEKYYS